MKVLVKERMRKMERKKKRRKWKRREDGLRLMIILATDRE